jgi:hypothetical protein
MVKDLPLSPARSSYAIHSFLIGGFGLNFFFAIVHSTLRFSYLSFSSAYQSPSYAKPHHTYFPIFVFSSLIFSSSLFLYAASILSNQQRYSSGSQYLRLHLLSQSAHVHLFLSRGRDIEDTLPDVSTTNLHGSSVQSSMDGPGCKSRSIPDRRSQSYQDEL